VALDGHADTGSDVRASQHSELTCKEIMICGHLLAVTVPLHTKANLIHSNNLISLIFLQNSTVSPRNHSQILQFICVGVRNLSRTEHVSGEIFKQRTDIGKYSFVNRTTQFWNQLPRCFRGSLLQTQAVFEKGLGK
jgi:hypothetical protein